MINFALPFYLCESSYCSQAAKKVAAAQTAEVCYPLYGLLICYPLFLFVYNISLTYMALFAQALDSTSRAATKKRASKQDASSSKRAKSTLHSRGDDPDVLSVADFRSIFSGCFGGNVIMPQESPEVTDALKCLSQVCLGSTLDKSVVRDSSRVLTPEMIYSLQTVVCISVVIFFLCDHSFLIFPLILVVV